MKPLAFVNWRTVNTYFCVVIWLLVAILAMIIIGHIAHDAPAAAHAAAAKIVR
jgi:hypothetical protein